LSITQIGKHCHDRCAIFRQTGDCIMPRMGLFARVLAGGAVAVGDPVEIEETVPRSAFQTVVLTLSDRCAAGLTQDTAGPAVSALLRESLPRTSTAPKSCPTNAAAGRAPTPLRRRPQHRSLVAVGGTGLSPRDITPEAVRDVIERPTPGFDEAMRAASLAHTKLAMLSRACSGVRGQTLILSVPGSEPAAVENLRAILPACRTAYASCVAIPRTAGEFRPDRLGARCAATPGSTVCHLID